MHPQQPAPDPTPRPVPQSAETSSAGDGPVPAAPRRRRGTDRRQRDERAVRHFLLDHVLKPEDRPAYEAMMADPRQTNRMLHAWLQARGYRVGYQAVQRHRRHFELNLKDVRRNALVAHQFSDAARAVGGPTAFAEASQTRIEQLLLERLFTMTGDEKLSGREWAEFTKAIGHVLSNRRQSEAIRAEYEDRARKAAEAVEEQVGGRKGEAAFNGVEIANCVRRILGVPLPGEPVPDSQNQNQESERSREIVREVRGILEVPPLQLPPLKPSEPSEN